jgi:hypothetical protein
MRIFFFENRQMQMKVVSVYAVIAVMVMTVTVQAGTIMIDSGEPLADLNDLTEDGNAVETQQSFATTEVIGGSRVTRANSTVVNTEYSKGIRSYSPGDLFGDIGNYGAEGTYTFVYGKVPR